MANFVLVYTGGGMPPTEAERGKVMEAWGAWFGRLGESVVDMGNPFASRVKSIDSTGAEHDSPVGTQATGYSIIKADSLEAAVDLAKGCPVLKSGAKITVYEISPAM
jgi:hypothetical protein